MSGEPTPTVQLQGPEAERLIGTLTRMGGYDMALIGGFAVVARLGAALRATNDIDSVFDNPTDTPMVVRLVGAGVGQPVEASRAQSIDVDGTVVDVIDTTALPADVAELPAEPKDKLFVCAHRFGYETASPIRLATGDHHVTIRVATPAALVAMKSHALRYASAPRRTLKRASDLFDLYKLIESSRVNDLAASLADTPWGLDRQVLTALTEDVAGHYESAAANLRSSGVTQIAATDPDDFIDVISQLLEALK